MQSETQMAATVVQKASEPEICRRIPHHFLPDPISIILVDCPYAAGTIRQAPDASKVIATVVILTSWWSDACGLHLETLRKRALNDVPLGIAFLAKRKPAPHKAAVFSNRRT